MAIWFRRITTVLAVAYPVALLAAVALLRFVGESYWVSALVLFLPRWGFALPLLALVPALVKVGVRRLWWTQLAALLVLLFPLMGLVMPGIGRSPDGPTVRVLSFNVNSVNAGAEAVAAEITRHSPDIVVLQESVEWLHLAGALHRTYANVDESTQFVLATNYRVTSVTDPPRVEYYGALRSPRFMRYVVETPLGPLTLYSVHPVSPRESFHAFRGQGLRKEIRSGRLFEGAASREIADNAGLRMLQVRTFARMAAKESGPTVVLGDTNQPSLTALFESELGGFVDAFRHAGWGFGYTYPAGHAWMRIDRVLTSPTLNATRFETGCRGVSDHLCVVTDLARAR